MIRNRRSFLLMCALTLVAASHAGAAITIDTVPVGDLGNASDPLTGNLYGSVSYAYRIGATEVTNAQYVAFLNAKAKSDSLGLYNSFMGSNTVGGIARSGSSPNFSYAVKANMGDKPVCYVSWYDAIRFTNWLANGQGNGSTETGAYTLLGGTPTPSNSNTIIRSPGAAWFLPTENEWYKAAYFQPATQGGDTDNYWLYATKSNTAPTIAAANSVGDISNPGADVVNYSNGAAWNGLTGNATTVGSAGPLSESFYGTSDQSGNFLEWNETIIDSYTRGVRGGAFDYHDTDLFYMQSLYRITIGDPSLESIGLGFRVASVPEPSTLTLTVLGGLSLLYISRRRMR